MKVVIKFNDENKELARAIGLGLAFYGDPGAAQRLQDLAAGTTSTTEHTTTKKVGDLEMTEKRSTKVEPKADLPESPPPVEDPPAEDLPAESPPPAAPPPVEDPGETDEHGTVFNPEFCSKSEKPFYATGKRVGQWKKKRGVDQDEYDMWYEDARPAVSTSQDGGEPSKVDTAAAFAADPNAPAAADPALPTTPGDLMKWCAEQTAAGVITGEQVTAAYQACGITVTDMFGPEGAAHVKAVLAELTK